MTDLELRGRDGGTLTGAADDLERLRGSLGGNAICPGYIETPINAAFWRTETGQATIKRFPRRRVGKPEDLDGILILLASDASRFLTGAAIPVDDGQSLAG